MNFKLSQRDDETLDKIDAGIDSQAVAEEMGIVNHRQPNVQSRLQLIFGLFQ